METALVKIIGEYGLGLGVLAILGLFGRGVLGEIRKILERDHEERMKWSDIIIGFQKSITEHTQNAQAFHREVADSHKYQKEEHEKLSNQMDEVTRALGRINGYKHD